MWYTFAIVIPQIIPGNIYTVLFAGLLLGGETALLPAVYFGIEGTLYLPLVILISVVATAVSDTFWYALGRSVPMQKIASSWWLASYEKHVLSLSKLFAEKGLVILFLSKFVYGTRTAAQILCGVNKIKFAGYFAVNIAGILALNSFFIVLGLVLKDSLSALVASPHTVWASLALFVVVAVILQTAFKELIWKKRFQQ